MTATGPLAGVRVLDLTSVMLGPYCTRIMADLGADVTKVEPASGDDARWIGPARSPGMGATFMILNSGKRSLAVNLKDPRGRAALSKLIQRTDVVVHSMRAEAAGRLALTYKDVAVHNPRVVHSTIQGFGPAGPAAGRPAYDDVIQAACGMADLQGRHALGEPQYVASVIADKTVGLIALSGILAALVERGHSGRGQAIEIPMFEAMVHFVLAEHLYGGVFEPPLDVIGYPRALSPHRHPYRTADGYIAVMPYNDSHWAAFFDVLGRPDLADDPRFIDVGARTVHIDDLYGFVDGGLRQRTTAEWIALLQAQDIPCAAVASLDDLVASNDLRGRGVIGTFDHPTEGRIRTLPIPVDYGRTPRAPDRPAPRLGQHSVEILCDEAGLEEDLVAELVRDGVVMTAPASSAEVIA